MSWVTVTIIALTTIARPAPGGSVPSVGPAQVRDPVCGMTIERATAKTCAHRDTVYYFCSDQCRSKFEAAPETFTASAA